MTISLKALRLLLFAGCFSLSAPAQTSTPEAARQLTPKEQAWNLLRAGVRSPKNDQRATAVCELEFFSDVLSDWRSRERENCRSSEATGGVCGSEVIEPEAVRCFPRRPQPCPRVGATPSSADS
jgi:hypothetical protein